MGQKKNSEKVVLTDKCMKSNLAVGVGAGSPQVDMLWSAEQKAEGAAHYM